MKRTNSSIRINAELKAFLESGVSVVVGTHDAEFVPEITRAWGLLVSKDRTSISLCAPLATSRKTLDNLADNQQMTVCCSLPTSYKTVQLKGQCTRQTDPNRADLAVVKRHRQAFGRMNELVGFPRQRSEIFWQSEVEGSPTLVKLHLVLDQVFDQTPGPDAGSPL